MMVVLEFAFEIRRQHGMDGHAIGVNGSPMTMIDCRMDMK